MQKQNLTTQRQHITTDKKDKHKRDLCTIKTISTVNETEMPLTDCLSSVLKKIYAFLKRHSFLIIFLLSLLLIGFEEFMEAKVFSCPCRHDLNVQLTVCIFIGPALFIFELLFLFLRPFREKCSRFSAGADDDTQLNCPKAFTSCLIPPVMWVIILLLDGDYFACAMTYWKGIFAFDNQLNRSWCKPTEKFRNVTALQNLTQTHIHQSQIYGYGVSTVFIVFPIIYVGICDCCGKSAC